MNSAGILICSSLTFCFIVDCCKAVWQVLVLAVLLQANIHFLCSPDTFLHSKQKLHSYSHSLSHNDIPQVTSLIRSNSRCTLYHVTILLTQKRKSPSYICNTISGLIMLALQHIINHAEQVKNLISPMYSCSKQDDGLLAQCCPTPSSVTFCIYAYLYPAFPFRGNKTLMNEQ